MNPNTRWRPVCLTVHADEGIDASAIKQWLQSKQILKTLDLSDLGLTSTAGPISDCLAADKQASACNQHNCSCFGVSPDMVLPMQAAASAGTEYVLTVGGKARAVQQQLEADKAIALAAEKDTRLKNELDCSTALKVGSLQAYQPMHCSLIQQSLMLHSAGCSIPLISFTKFASHLCQISRLHNHGNKAKQHSHCNPASWWLRQG